MNELPERGQNRLVHSKSDCNLSVLFSLSRCLLLFPLSSLIARGFRGKLTGNGQQGLTQGQTRREMNRSRHESQRTLFVLARAECLEEGQELGFLKNQFILHDSTPR